MQLEDGSYRSFASWGKGLPTLLPEVDEVIFMEIDAGGEARCVARAPWAEMMDVVPDLLLDTKMFPPRYYVSKFPTSDQLVRFA
jgi:hypothetical protein